MDRDDLLSQCAAEGSERAFARLVPELGRELPRFLLSRIQTEQLARAASRAISYLLPTSFARVLLREIGSHGQSSSMTCSPVCLRAICAAIVALDPSARPFRGEHLHRLLHDAALDEAWLPSFFETLPANLRLLFLERAREKLAPGSFAALSPVFFELSVEPAHRDWLVDRLAEMKAPAARQALRILASPPPGDTPAGLATEPRGRSRKLLAAGEWQGSSDPRPRELRVFVVGPESWRYELLVAIPKGVGAWWTYTLRADVAGGICEGAAPDLLTRRGLWMWRHELEEQGCLLAELPPENGRHRVMRALDGARELEGSLVSSLREALKLPAGRICTEFAELLQRSARNAAFLTAKSGELYRRSAFDLFLFHPDVFGLHELVQAAQLFYESENGDREAPSYRKSLDGLLRIASERVMEREWALQALKASLRLFAEIYFYRGRPGPAAILAAVHRALFSKKLEEIPFTRDMLRHSLELELDGRVEVERLEG